MTTKGYGCVEGEGGRKKGEREGTLNFDSGGRKGGKRGGKPCRGGHYIDLLVVFLPQNMSNKKKKKERGGMLSFT